jgi:hypothetical protein
MTVENTLKVKKKLKVESGKWKVLLLSVYGSIFTFSY